MQNNVDEIKSKLDIVDIIGEYFPLKQSGANFKAPCPFHNEKTPSFMVSREKQIFHCFGCNEGGDMFTFVQKMEGVEFPEALRILAQKAGVELVHQDPVATNLKTRLGDVNREAADWFQAKLSEEIGKSTLTYLLNTRKITPQTIRDFKLGFAPESWDGLSKYLKTKNFSDQEIKQSGLVVEKQGGGYYDRFRNRVMIPLTDHHGVIVGFTGRTMSAQEPAKYVNTPQTLIFNKSALLFALDKAKQEIKQHNSVILVEGQMDVIACHQAGTKNVIGISGTALTHDHLSILKRYTQNLAFCLDTDQAGQMATQRSISLAWQNDFNTKILSLPKGFKDPDELIKHDKNLWLAAIRDAQNAMDYFFDKTFANLNITDIDQKKKAASYLLNLISQLGSPVEQDHYLNLLGNRLGVEQNFLREALRKSQSHSKNAPSPARKSTAQKPDDLGDHQKKKNKILSERILSLILSEPSYINKIINELPPEMLDVHYQELYKILVIFYTKANLKQNGNEGRLDVKKYLEQNKPQLVGLFDVIEMLARSEWLDQKEADIRREMIQVIKILKRDYLDKKLKFLQTEINKFERIGDQSKLNQLMEEYSQAIIQLQGV